MSINFRDVTMKYMLQLIAENMKNELREKLIYLLWHSLFIAELTFEIIITIRRRFQIHSERISGGGFER